MFSGKQERLIRAETLLNQNSSALIVSETSTRVRFCLFTLVFAFNKSDQKLTLFV